MITINRETDAPEPNEFLELEKFLLEIKEDLKILLDEGIDDWWWTASDDNFKLINHLRIKVGLEPISEEYRKSVQIIG